MRTWLEQFSPRAPGSRALAAPKTGRCPQRTAGRPLHPQPHTQAETPSWLRLAAARSSERSRAHTCTLAHQRTHICPERCAYHSGTPAHALADQDDTREHAHSPHTHRCHSTAGALNPRAHGDTRARMQHSQRTPTPRLRTAPARKPHTHGHTHRLTLARAPA